MEAFKPDNNKEDKRSRNHLLLSKSLEAPRYSSTVIKAKEVDMHPRQENYHRRI